MYFTSLHFTRNRNIWKRRRGFFSKKKKSSSSFSYIYISISLPARKTKTPSGGWSSSRMHTYIFIFLYFLCPTYGRTYYRPCGSIIGRKYAGHRPDFFFFEKNQASGLHIYSYLKRWNPFGPVAWRPLALRASSVKTLRVFTSSGKGLRPLLWELIRTSRRLVINSHTCVMRVRVWDAHAYV